MYISRRKFYDNKFIRCRGFFVVIKVLIYYTLILIRVIPFMSI